MPTTNNNWPTPVATDLVKDGWEAIKDLGDAIDTTLGVYAPSTPGLTLINTTSFSGVSSISLPTGTFSSTYDDYEIHLEISTSTATDYLGSRYRAAGSDISTGDYQSATWNTRMANTSSVGDSSGANATSFTKMGYHISGKACYLRTTWFSPNRAVNKGYVGQFLQIDTNAGELQHVGGNFDTTTVADSVTFFATTGNFTGVAYAFGYAR
jgi:hypothetical protein